MEPHVLTAGQVQVQFMCVMDITHVLLQATEPSFCQCPFLRERSQKLIWSRQHHLWAALKSSALKEGYSEVWWPGTLKFGMRLYSESNTNTHTLSPTFWTRPMLVSWE